MPSSCKSKHLFTSHWCKSRLSLLEEFLHTLSLRPFRWPQCFPLCCTSSEFHLKQTLSCSLICSICCHVATTFWSALLCCCFSRNFARLLPHNKKSNHTSKFLCKYWTQIRMSSRSCHEIFSDPLLLKKWMKNTFLIKPFLIIIIFLLVYKPALSKIIFLFCFLWLDMLQVVGDLRGFSGFFLRCEKCFPLHISTDFAFLWKLFSIKDKSTLGNIEDSF